MKRFWPSFVIIVICAVLFCGCTMPFSPRRTPQKPAQFFDVYVCGAVQNEGYVTLPSGSTIGQAVAAAGLIAQTWQTSPNVLITSQTTVVVVDYFDGTKQCSPVNVNGNLVRLRMPIENVTPEVVGKLADYLSSHGKIANKKQLAEALGDDYQSNFYKFFVSEQDYEAAS